MFKTELIIITAGSKVILFWYFIFFFFFPLAYFLPLEKDFFLNIEDIQE